MRAVLLPLPPAERLVAAYQEAAVICDSDVAVNEAIGKHGLQLIEEIRRKKGGREPVRILTHCNAGWLATVDWGTALARSTRRNGAGIPLLVWVDETRPRSQGASLTAWELAAEGIDHQLIVDNAGGHLMQHGLVDLCIVGTDRTTATGECLQQDRTYLKALAAHANRVPFYVALPGSTVDWRISDGVREIPIEERGQDEVLWVQGRTRDACATGEDRAGSNPGVQIRPLT